MATSKSNGRPKEAETDVGNIFLFIPNLIGIALPSCLFRMSSHTDNASHSSGYSRVVLAGASLYFMSYHPNYCTILYSLSCLLDALDGWAARKFNQSTKFGAVLDMVTDRCTTSCLLVFLSAAYTNYAVLFQVLISLDLASHYMHMYASFYPWCWW
jgi:CDP-diacylglycerol--inositol 3-phosphatidyltransferase